MDNILIVIGLMGFAAVLLSPVSPVVGYCVLQFPMWVRKTIRLITGKDYIKPGMTSEEVIFANHKHNLSWR